MSHKEDTLIVDLSNVQARFVDSRSQTEVPQDFIDMFLPEAWSLRVTLHDALYRDHHAVMNRWITEVLCSPFVKRAVQLNVEALSWARGVTKCVADFGTVNNNVIDCCDRLE